MSIEDTAYCGLCYALTGEEHRPIIINFKNEHYRAECSNCHLKFPWAHDTVYAIYLWNVVFGPLNIEDLK